MPGAPPGPADAKPAACAGGEAPIVIGSVGVQSGVVGELFRNSIRTIQAAITAVNNRGGIKCHPVKLLVGDDGNDPARHQALVREFVEQRKAIAFVFNAAPLSGRSSIDYVTQKRIPVIGSESGSAWFYESPMFFVPGSSSYALAAIAIHAGASVTVPQGKTKAAVITCQEVEQCDVSDQAFIDLADQVGYTLVSKAKGTLTQPDYTTQCIEARNAGAQVLLTALDGASQHRLASSCAKIGFKVPLVIEGVQSQDNMKDNPDLEGSIIASNYLPWLMTDHPAIAEYLSVVRKDQATRNLTPDLAGVTGWATFKMFQLAAEAGMKASPEAPTNEDVLNGLYRLNGNDLGGLTYPLNIEPGKPSRKIACGWRVMVGKGKFTTDGKQFCVKGLEP